MKAARTAGTLVVALLALAGCAAGTGPGTAPPDAATAGGAAAVDWAKAERVDVALVDFDFQPARIVLERGQPYQLHLENRGKGGHNFDAPAFFRAVTLRDGPMATEVRDGKGAVELARGQSKDIDLVPTEPGTYPLECTHLLHAAIFGMTGEIVVK
jgi:uncharacterized cupredoxin-like copper-binding protein